MKRRVWTVVLILYNLCFGHSGVVSADGVAPVYVPNGPHAEALTAAENIDIQSSLPTVTVRGFLNFRTTVDGTVIVFTPASETAEPNPPTPSSHQQQATKEASLDNVGDTAEVSEIQDLAYTSQPKTNHDRELENEANADDDDGQSFRHLKEVSSDEAFLQQPYPTVTVASSQPEASLVKTTNRPTPSLPQYPTGLVTVLEGTHVENSATTIYETKVIGTYIDGKYAQILQSTSRITYSSTEKTPEQVEIKPTSTSRERVTSSTRPAKPQFTSRAHAPSPVSKYPRPSLSHPDRRRDEGLVSNALLQSSFKLPESTPQRSSHPTQYLDSVHTRSSSYSRFRRPRPTTTSKRLEDENTVSEPRASRRSTPFRYVLPQRNTPTVQLNRFKVRLPTVRNDASDHLTSPESEDQHHDEELDDDHDPLLPVDPAQVVYEKTTLTSEVTIHVGRRKSVRTLTITTTVPRTIRRSSRLSSGFQDVAAAHNALVATSVPEGDDSPQIVVTRTYTTTERMLRTSVVPVLEGVSTTFHTVTESFFILKIITAYKTLPPGDVTVLNTQTDDQLQPSIDPAVTGLLYGATPLPPSPQQHLLQTPQLQPSETDSASLPLPLDLSHPLISLGAALSQNPLAAVYLGLQQLNRQVTMYSTLTKTSTYVTTDTVYSTKVVSFYDGRRTRSRTLSESVSTTERTLTSYTTTVTPYLNTQALQHLIGSQPPLPLPPPTTQYSTVTSSYTIVTTATDYSTRVYTLIYNAISTKLRTVTSTSLYETTITTFKTSEVPIVPTAPPGGYPYFG